MGTPSAIIHDWFEKVWNQCDASCIDEMLSEECELTGLAENTIRSPDDFRDFHNMLNSLFQDINITIDDLMEQGETFSGVVTVRATHRPTSKPVEFQSSFFGTVREGKIKRATNLVDYLSTLIQIGSLPPDVIETGLTSA